VLSKYTKRRGMGSAGGSSLGDTW